MGTFTASIDYDRAPRTAANFISLAEGSRGWVDLETGLTRHDPFYDNIIFHRVIAGFVIQAGSPAGTGTDGPGYSFEDEFDPALRHDAAYVLSMANSGPHSNGSQFFVTLAPASHLDDKHSVFGHVTSGQPVVDAIGAVPVGAGGRPLTPVSILSVTIVRNGPEAMAFDVEAQGLPTVRPLAATGVSVAAGSTELEFEKQQFAEYFLSHSARLSAWDAIDRTLELLPPSGAPTDVSSAAAGDPTGFFQVTEVAYPPPLFTAASLEGTTVTITDFFNATLVADLEAGGTGTWTVPEAALSGTFPSWSYIPEPYRGRLFVQFDGTLTVGGRPIVSFSPSLVFDTPSSGTHRGNATLFNRNTGQNETQEMTGTFTLSP